MEREKFMQEARLTAHQILEGKENGIMNLVQRAWAEGKRNVEVETLRAAIDEALDRREQKEPPKDAVYPTWCEWLIEVGVFPEMMSSIPSIALDVIREGVCEPIPADIAQKLGLKPKGEA